MSFAATPAHAKLVDELRKRSAGSPEFIPQKARPPEFCRLLCRLDIVRPLLHASLRCTMVHSFCCGSLGVAALFLAGALHSRGHSIAARNAAIVGIVSLGLTFKGLPLGVTFLEARTKPGFYGEMAGEQADRNRRIQTALQAWLKSFRPCPWIRGDFCTVLPFLTNRSRGYKPSYERVWLEAEDGERFATDLVFPPTGFSPDRPVVVLLTGLAPSKHWSKAGGFICDAAWSLTTRANMTVAIVVARGTMDTQVKKNLFHGARVKDLRQVVCLLRESLDATVGDTSSKPPMFAAGYSMGAIILANYCGVFGGDSRLQGAIHFSGLHDAVANMKFHYSAATWQAYLAFNLKNTFCTGNILEECKHRGVNASRIMSRHVSSVMDIDSEFVAVYNGYISIVHYYEDMSVGCNDKWKAIDIPLLAIAARDDPITHCDALHAERFSSGNSNMLFLITEHGGHCGWPWGIFPWQRGWDFCNEAIQVFVETVCSETSEQSK